MTEPGVLFAEISPPSPVTRTIVIKKKKIEYLNRNSQNHCISKVVYFDENLLKVLQSLINLKFCLSNLLTREIVLDLKSTNF